MSIVDHKGQTQVKIVIISVDNKIRITFLNGPGEIDENESYIVDAFDTAFEGWKFNIDKKEGVESRIDSTIINCHFLDKETSEPILNSNAQG